LGSVELGTELHPANDMMVEYMKHGRNEYQIYQLINLNKISNIEQFFNFSIKFQ